MSKNVYFLLFVCPLNIIFLFEAVQPTYRTHTHREFSSLHHANTWELTTGKSIFARLYTTTDSYK